MKCLGKRFIFATIAIICASVVTVRLEYTGVVYLRLVTTIVGIFLASQTVTDYKGGEKK